MPSMSIVKSSLSGTCNVLCALVVDAVLEHAKRRRERDCAVAFSKEDADDAFHDFVAAVAQRDAVAVKLAGSR